MSIRLRLTLYWAAVLAVIMAIAASAVLVIFTRQQWAGLDAALLEEADTSAAAIAHAGEPAAAIMVRRLSEERDIGPGRRVRLIVGDRIVADFGSRHADLPITQRRSGIFDGRANVYRYAIMPLSIGDQQAFLEDGVDASQIRNSIARLRTVLLVVTPMLLILCVVGGYWLAGRALAPIVALSTSLAAIEPTNLRDRLRVGSVQDEIARLAGAINALLERLEAASLTERRFISDAAHELRTPLTVLRTGLEITLNRERGAREQHEALQAALKEVVALCRMTDELLTLARLSEEARLERVDLDFGALVHEVVEAVEPLTQAKNLILTASGNGHLMVHGNADHLRRLVVNLLDNAVKFSPDSGRIAVTLERRENRAIFRVSDSGPGIAPADLPLIFDRFFRGSGPKTNGSGLGLSLCREIVRLHRGKILAHNNPEKGCEFVVTLPLKDARSI
ncbi:MAG: sensor histidine kinase [Candidatus Binataceae bacterium]